MALATMQTSFGAGELSPALYARVDLAKYSVGAALLRNFYVDYRGGASTRAGTQYLNQARSIAIGQPHLIPFIVGTETAYAVEFGNHYCRFFAEGAPIYEDPTTITGITQASPGVVTSAAHGYSNGDEVLISGVGGMVEINNKNYLIAAATTNTYELQDLQGNIQNTTGYHPYTSGGTAARVFTLTSPYSYADLPDVKFTQSANVLTLDHPSYPPYNLTRLTSNSFSLDAEVIGPTVAPPSSVAAVCTRAYTNDYVYGFVVTAVSADGKEESLPTLPEFAIGSCFGEGGKTDIFYNITWAASASETSCYKIYAVGPMASRTGGGSVKGAPTPTVFGYIGQSLETSFVDNGIAPDYSRTPPQFQDPFAPGQIASVRVTGAGAGYTTQFIVPLIFTGDGTGAAGYAVVNTATNTIVGAVITNPGHGYTTCVVSVATGGATFSNTIGQQSGTYPACVTYFQQRRVHGGTDNFPESLVASQPGNYPNFDTSVVSSASDAITVSMASTQVNALKSLTTMPTGLIAFTTGGAFLVSGGGPSTAITPANVTALPQASSGANDLPPLVVNYDVLYCQNRGAVVRDLAFNFYVQSYTGTDRSVLASHLFFNHTLTDWCYAEEPFRLILTVRDDGVLLPFTYVPEQEVFAWTQWDTNGLFVSVCSIPEGQENAVYVIVRRLVAGQFLYMVERFASRQWASLPDAWTLDCGLRLPLTYPAGAISLSGYTGQGVIVGANANVFVPGDAGKILWAGGGKAVVSNYTDATHCIVDVLEDFPVFKNDPLMNPLPYAEGEWSLDAPVSTVYNLGHLNGLMVSALVDGMPQPATLVTEGALALQAPATKVTVGLAYQCQLQTLRIDLGEPTTQGKRKIIPAVTLRLQDTVGLSVGPDFAHLYDVKDLQVPYTPPIASYTGDIRIVLDTVWNTEGQLCIQQDAPLPATVLGLIPEVLVGDTQR